MNKFIKLAAATVALLTATFTAPAQQTAGAPDLGFSAFAGGGTQFNASAATNYAIMPTYSKTPFAQAILTFLNATSDKTASVVQFYTPTNAAIIVGTNWGFTNLSTSSNFFVLSTNGAAIASNIVIMHNITNGPPTYEYAQVFGLGTPVWTNITGGFGGGASITNIAYAFTNTTATIYTNLPGDTVFYMVPNGNVPIVSVNVALNITAPETGMYASPRGAPVLMTITGGTNATINAFSGIFIP